MTKLIDSGVNWIGQIPEQWNLIRLKDKYRNIKEIVGERVLDFERLALTLNGVIKRDKEDDKGLQPKDFDNYQILRAGDFVFKMIDLQNVSTSRVGLSPYDGIVSPAYLRFSPKDNKANRFLYYYLMSMYFNCVFNSLGGDGVRSSLSAEDMGNIICPFPTTEEQQKIADFLDKKCSQIERLIKLQEKEIEKLKEYKSQFVLETICKGIDTKEFQETGIDWIGEMPKHWCLNKIKYATKISRGLFNHRPRNDERLYDGQYPFIQTGDVARATKYITTYSQTLNDFGKSVSKEFKKGTLTMTIAANVGDVSILDFDAYFPDSVVGFTPLHDNSSEYLYYIFLAMKNEFIRASIVSTQLNLNIERIKDMKIPFTDNKEEQKRIVEFLNNKCEVVDSLIQKKNDKIKMLQEYKKSLIYECVTGKKEV